MPEDGVNWVEKSKILTFEEIGRLVRLFNNLGIKNFRLTGGEPLVRQNFVELCRLLKTNNPEISLAITTNAIGLADIAQELKDAGVDRLNISLDTLDRNKFGEITRRDEFEKVMAGIDAANLAGFHKIKINAVSIRDFNTDAESLK